MRQGLWASVLVLAACNANVRFDPEGFRCDPGGVCPAGYVCLDDVCHRGSDKCANVSCATTPPATCVDGRTLRTFAGRCEVATGQCAYDPTDTTCPNGCVDGACLAMCTPDGCSTPPAPSCADAMTLRTFSSQGTCEGGQCRYPSSDVSCPNGCTNGLCQGVDLCQGVTCAMPPRPTCVGATTLRSFSAMGTCEPGTGQCAYSPTDTPCAAGCVSGSCVAPSLTFTQIGPRVRFAVSAVDVAPNSGGDSVLAVGAGGRMARWNGQTWSEVTTPSIANLNRVAFVTGGLAYVVGDNKTAFTYRPSTGLLQPVSLAGANNAKLVGLSGQAEDDVFIADATGGYWRLGTAGWSDGSLPGSGGPYAMKAAYLDESGRERIVGLCGSGAGKRSCVAYRFLAGATPSWRIDTRLDDLGYDAVGGGFEEPDPLVSDALLGQTDNDVVDHNNSVIGTFTSLTISPPLEGAGVVGVTAQAGSVTRSVYVLTSSKGTVGHLYRLTQSGATITAVKAFDTFQGEEVMSVNESTGVIVAEVHRAASANTIVRRSVVVSEALDVGDPLAGASLDASGNLVLGTAYGDLAVGNASHTFDFRRPPDDVSIEAVEARNGTGTLLAGRMYGTSTGLVYRVGSSYSVLATTPGTTWNALCRVSDTEGWVVGSGGAIASITSGGLTGVTSGTSKDLVAVDCRAGEAVACGVDGTVVVFRQGAWSSVTPAFPASSRRLSACVLARGEGLLVGGDSVFYAFESGAWAALPNLPSLKGLIFKSPTEVYGSVVSAATGSDIFRFNGSQWSPSLLHVSGELGGGVQMGARVVWGGTAGVVVEGR